MAADPVSKSQTRPTDRSRVQSVTRAVALLNTIADSNVPLSATQLKAKTGLDRTVVHRLLRTLEAENLVVKLDSRYAIGPKTLLYGNSYLDRLALRRIALPYLVDFHIRSVGSRPWAVTLGVPTSNEVLLVERLWNRYAPLDTLLEIGTRLHFDHSAMGRCVLAYLPPDRIAQAVGPKRAKELAQNLKAIRERGGVEFSSSEIRPGISAISVVILRADEPAGIVAVSGTKLEDQLSPDSELAGSLKRLAAQISTATN